MKILVAPLNWGLGHATRCIPIIQELRCQGAEVILASDGAAYELLKREFPDLEIFALPAYNIRYPFRSMLLSMAIQMPKILRGCVAEHFWLRHFLKDRVIDVVIADNRFGFFSRKTYSVFMTHQVNILIPLRFFQPLVNRVNHFFIKKFDICWIPDFADEPNLSGQLAHGFFSKKIKIKYLGALSRMKQFRAEKKYRVAIVLSGPEPQRSILEKKVIHQLKTFIEANGPDERYILVRGTSDAPFTDFSNIPHLEIYDLLTTPLLNQKIMESEVVLCRSGYSSIMDLYAMQMPAVLIPTPGQTEQEYIAAELYDKKRFFYQIQDDFDLTTALEEYPKFKNFREFGMKRETLTEIVSELLKF